MSTVQNPPAARVGEHATQGLADAGAGPRQLARGHSRAAQRSDQRGLQRFAAVPRPNARCPLRRCAAGICARLCRRGARFRSPNRTRHPAAAPQVADGAGACQRTAGATAGGCQSETRRWMCWAIGRAWRSGGPPLPCPLPRGERGCAQPVRATHASAVDPRAAGLRAPARPPARGEGVSARCWFQRSPAERQRCLATDAERRSRSPVPAPATTSPAGCCRPVLWRLPSFRRARHDRSGARAGVHA